MSKKDYEKQIQTYDEKIKEIKNNNNITEKTKEYLINCLAVSKGLIVIRYEHYYEESKLDYISWRALAYYYIEQLNNQKIDINTYKQSAMSLLSYNTLQTTAEEKIEYTFICEEIKNMINFLENQKRTFKLLV